MSEMKYYKDLLIPEHNKQQINLMINHNIHKKPIQEIYCNSISQRGHIAKCKQIGSCEMCLFGNNHIRNVQLFKEWLTNVQ